MRVGELDVFVKEREREGGGGRGKRAKDETSNYGSRSVCENLPHAQRNDKSTTILHCGYRDSCLFQVSSKIGGLIEKN